MDFSRLSSADLLRVRDEIQRANSLAEQATNKRQQIDALIAYRELIDRLEKMASSP
jgi:hypothetical protein